MYGAKNIDLPPSKLWLFTHNKTFGNNFGESDLRGAFRSWWAKRFIINFWNVYLERMGSPMTLMQYPQGASDSLKETLKQIMRNLSSKTEILVPDGVKIALLEATRAGQASYKDALDYHNSAIARSILMTGLYGMDSSNLRQSEGNSQGFIQLRLLFKMADQISQALQQSLMCQVIYPLIDLNFDKPIYPDFIWQDYGQFEGTVVADEIRQLHAAGILDMDQQDVNYVRSVVGLPLRDAEEHPDEVLRPNPTPLTGEGAASPGAAPQGNNRAGDAVKK
jgi:phage gp29-like protein